MDFEVNRLFRPSSVSDGISQVFPAPLYLHFLICKMELIIAPMYEVVVRIKFIVICEAIKQCLAYNNVLDIAA